MIFVGIHQPAWLERLGVPCMLSRRRIEHRRTMPRAIAPWVLDSGGFTELSLHGRWTMSARAYAAIVRRCRDEIGQLAWAAPQDWMCEPDMLRRTGLSVEEHQARTIANLLELRAIAPDLPIIPVLQAWIPGDYARHVDAYLRAGVDLEAEPVVGMGTLCRRPQPIFTLARSMLDFAFAPSIDTEGKWHCRKPTDRGGLRVHGFGVKGIDLETAFEFGHLVSADSMAWSFHERREQTGGQNDIAVARAWQIAMAERCKVAQPAPVAPPVGRPARHGQMLLTF